MPDWLDAVCNNAYGSSFAGGDGEYGGRDTRSNVS